jgi:hypothetical protein
MNSSCDLRPAVAYLPHVANLGVETLACLLAGPCVARFDNHRARVVELFGSQDRLRPPKGRAAGLEWMAFCLAPFDAGIDRTEHGGDFAAAEAERLVNQPVNFGYQHLGLACL